ncbi:hypothetical protein ACPWUF_09335 [Bisgaard Taxon 46]
MKINKLYRFILPLVAIGAAISYYQHHTRQDKISPPNASNTTQNVELEKFNQSIKITPTERHIARDKYHDEIASMTYQIHNLSNKTIKKVHWNSIYIWDSNYLYTHDLPILFEAKLRPNKTQTISEIILLSKLKEEQQNVLKDSNKNIKVEIIARSIEFEDGSAIIVPNY